MALPDRLPAHPEHRRDDRPADPTASEPVDLLVDELLRTPRVSGQLDQPQRPRVNNGRTGSGGLLAMLAPTAALTATHANNDRDTRPHYRPHQRPGTPVGTFVGTPGW